ncbi:hypothetical protein LTR15_000146 [Elasticomyces elasticus]|nr:hypothetical protein LTR15_000146 [Elasticomyces elasticus]
MWCFRGIQEPLLFPAGDESVRDFYIIIERTKDSPKWLHTTSSKEKNSPNVAWAHAAVYAVLLNLLRANLQMSQVERTHRRSADYTAKPPCGDAGIHRTRPREIVLPLKILRRGDQKRQGCKRGIDARSNGNLSPLRKAALQLQTRLGGSSQDFLEAWRVLDPGSKPEQLREVAKTKLIIALNGIAELFGDSSNHDGNSDFFSALCRTLTLLITDLLGHDGEAHVAKKISPYQRSRAARRILRIARQPFCALLPDTRTCEDSLYYRYEPKTEDKLKADNASELLSAASEFAVLHTRVCIDAPNRWVTTASLVNYGRPIWPAYWNYVKVQEAKFGEVEGSTQEKLERLVVSRLLSGDKDRVARLLSAPQAAE